MRKIGRNARRVGRRSGSTIRDLATGKTAGQKITGVSGISNQFEVLGNADVGGQVEGLQCPAVPVSGPVVPALLRQGRS